MKKGLLATALGALVVAGVVYAEAAQDFTIHNETGFTINALSVDSSDKAEFGEDILGQDTLPSGESVLIKFAGYGKDVCNWDIRLEDMDGKAWDVYDLNLCETTDVTFKVVDGKVAYEAANGDE